MTKRTRGFLIGTLAAVLFYAFSIIFIYTIPDTYDSIAREDGIIEWLGALGFLGASILFIVFMIRSPHIRSGKKPWALVFVLCWALFSFFCFGEEISWGQRIFGLELAEEYQVENWREAEGNLQNLQNEINLHNMGFIEKYIGNSRLTVLIQFAAGLFLPLMFLFKKTRRFLHKIYFPVAPVYYILFFIGSYILTKTFLHPRFIDGMFNYNRINEFREMTIGVGFFLFALHGALFPQSIFIKETDEGTL